MRGTTTSGAQVIDPEDAEGFVADVEHLCDPGDPGRMIVTLKSGRKIPQKEKDVRKLRAVLPGTKITERGWDSAGRLDEDKLIITNKTYDGQWDELTAAKVNTLLGSLTDAPVLSVDMGRDQYVVMVALAYAPPNGDLHCLFDHIEGLVRIVRAEPEPIYKGYVLALLIPRVTTMEHLWELHEQIAERLNFVEPE